MSYIINSYRYSVTDNSFTMSVKTDNAGTSNNDQFTIPTQSVSYTYNYDVDWGDGNTDTGQTGDVTHTYASAGTYTIKITNTFPKIYFNNGGDKLKLLTVSQWGNIVWSDFASSFYGCSNLDVTATDTPDLSSVTSLLQMFRGCTSLVGNSSFDNWDVSSINTILGTFRSCSNFNQNLNSWNTSSITEMREAFLSATSFNGNITSWNTASVTNMNSMLRNTSFNQDVSGWNTGNVTSFGNLFRDSNIDQDLGVWNVTSLTDASSMFFNETLSTANYDSILALSDGWASQTVNTGVTFHGGNSTFTGSSVDSGTTDGTSTNKLIDSTQNFATTVSVGDAVKNTTDNTWTTVTAVDSNTQLSLNSDIMVSGETYVIYSSDAAKGKAHLIDVDGWTITDGGAV